MTPGCRSKSIIGFLSMMGRGWCGRQIAPKKLKPFPSWPMPIRVLASSHWTPRTTVLLTAPFRGPFDFPCRLFDASHRALNFIPRGSIA